MIQKIKNLNKVQIFIILFLLFICSTIIRSYLSCFPKTIRSYPDEIRYWDLAQSLLFSGNLRIHNAETSFYKILYPLLISPGFLFDKVLAQINAISIINSIIMSSAVFPAYLFAKKVLKNNFQALVIVIITLTAPDFVYSMTFMSEVSFYPLSIWLFYLVYSFLQEENNKKIIIKSCIIGFVSFLLYLNKEIALYYVLAFLFINLIKIVVEKDKKLSIISLLAYLSIFLCMDLILKAIFSSTVGGGYERQLSLTNIWPMKKFLFFLFGLAYNTIMLLLAFFYFPVVIPGFKFKGLKREDKYYYLFSITAMLVAIAVVTFSITSYEDFGSLAPRQHLRYYAPMLISFIVVFVKTMSIKEKLTSRIKILIRVFTGIICLLYLSILNYIPVLNLDGVLLKYYSNIIQNYTKTEQIHGVVFDITLLLFKLFICVIIIIGTVYVFRNKRKSTLVLLFSCILFINLLNTVISVKSFKDEYTIDSSRLSQVQNVNDFISGLDGNVLIVSNGFNRDIDTYITRESFYIRATDLISYSEERKFIDLNKDKLSSNFPYTPYNNLNSVEYIVTDETVDFISDYVEELHVNGIGKFHIYKNLDNTKIYYNQIYLNKTN